MDAMFKSWDGCVENGVATLRCIPIVLNNLVSAALIFVGITTAFLIVLAGIKFVTSGGDPKQVDSAKKILTFAIIGLVIVLSSFAIINFIAYTTGTPSITKMEFGK
jgi:hypothetical protein